MAHDVTAVIAVYNGADLLRRSIESVLGQTAPVAELLVVDDGSTDATGDVARSYGDRVTYVRQENRGPSAARNAAIEQARSTWIAFLDHDDAWLPTKLERQLAALDADPAAALCYCANRFHGLDGKTYTRHVSLADLPRTMRLRNPFPPSVVVARRSALLEVGGFDERLRGAEDWDLNVRLLARYPAVAVDEPLANYYEMPSSSSLRGYRTMLSHGLAMMDSTLLLGLTGANRLYWRRRIEATLYHRAAISARQLGDPAASLLVRSLARWPGLDERLKTLALELRKSVLGA